MRRMALSAAMLMSGLAQLHAGVYNLDSPRKYPSDYVQTHAPQAIEALMAYLFELRGIADSPLNLGKAPQPGTLRESCLKQLAALEAKQNQDVADRVNLSACLIRLGRYAKAQELLEKWLRQTPHDNALRALLLLNLAAALQEDDSLLQRSIEMQRQALESWPALVPGWKREEWSWYRQVEQYVLAVMELRNREFFLRGGRPAREQLPPDKLFPREERDLSKKIQFVGDSGEYEAGGIAWKQWQRLPADAAPVVLQLLLWRPLDSRLLWLYGELLNARGIADEAYYVLSDRLRDKDQWRNRDLNRHIRVLGDALAPYRMLFVDSAGTGENHRKQALLLWSLAPRGGLLAPPIGVAANEIGGVAAWADSGVRSGGAESRDGAVSQGADALRSAAALPDWRQMTISFIAGAVVAVLCLLQWQQWRRPIDRTLSEPRP